MAIDYYPGKSITDLQTLLDKAIAQKADGSIVELTVGGANGVRTRRERHADFNPDLQILQLRYSLWLRAQQVGDATQKAKYTNPYKERITQVKANYARFANS